MDLSAIHQKSQTMWHHSENTFLAEQGYYPRVENELHMLLSEWTPFDRSVDFGCGNGRFTFTISQYCNEIVGYDISPKLIKQACQLAKLYGNHSKIQFAIADISYYQLQKQYDLISLMGVSSTIISESIYQKILTTLSSSLKPNGFLLMRDSLQKSCQHEIIDNPDYSAIYRAQEYYIANLKKFGLKLLREIILTEDNNRINKLFLFKKP